MFPTHIFPEQLNRFELRAAHEGPIPELPLNDKETKNTE